MGDVFDHRTTAICYAGHGCDLTQAGASSGTPRPMLEELFDVTLFYVESRHHLAACNYVLGKEHGITLQAVLRDGKKLSDTRYYQPAKVGLDVAFTSALCEELKRPIDHIAAAALGLSLGELSAAAALRMWENTETAIHLACERGRVVHEMQPKDNRAWDTWAHVRCMRGILSDAIARLRNARVHGAETLEITNHNTDEIVLVAGHEEGLSALSTELAASGIKGVRTVKKMGLGAIFHHPCLSAAAPVFERLIYESGPDEPCIPLLSNVTSRSHEVRHFARLMGEHLRSPVEFTACMRTLKDMGIDRALIIGAPGALPALLAQRIAKDRIHVFDSMEAVQRAYETLGIT